MFILLPVVGAPLAAVTALIGIATIITGTFSPTNLLIGAGLLAIAF